MTDLDLIRAWLRRKVITEAVVTLLAGFGVLAVAWCLWSVVFMLSSTVFLAVLSPFAPPGRPIAGMTPHSQSIRLGLIALFLLVVALLFLGNARNERARQARSAKLRKERGSGMSEMTERDLASFELVEDVLYAGPRLTLAGVGLFRKAGRLARLDVESGARVLALLRKRDGRFSFREICAALPELNPTKFFPQLRDVEGVVFLTQEPCGLSLTKDLRDDIRSALLKPRTHAGGTQSAEPELTTLPDTPHRAPGPPHLQAYGFRATESLPELERAYRRLLEENDPARVSGLGTELEEIAQERADDIYETYRRLLEKHHRSPPE